MGPGAQGEFSPWGWINCSWLGAWGNLEVTPIVPLRPHFASWCPPPHLCTHRERQRTCHFQVAPSALPQPSQPEGHGWVSRNPTPMPGQLRGHTRPSRPCVSSCRDKRTVCSAPSRGTQASHCLLPPWASVSPPGAQDECKEKDPLASSPLYVLPAHAKICLSKARLCQHLLLQNLP